MQRIIMLASLLVACGSSLVSAQDRNTKVRNDRTRFAESTDWVYNDLSQGMNAAAAAKKPLLIVLRCIP